MQRLVSISILLLLPGCLTMEPHAWYKQGATSEDLRKAVAEAENYAIINTPQREILPLGINVILGGGDHRSRRNRNRDHDHHKSRHGHYGSDWGMDRWEDTDYRIRKLFRNRMIQNGWQWLPVTEVDSRRAGGTPALPAQDTPGEAPIAALESEAVPADEIYTFKGKQYHPSNTQPFTGRAVSRHANGKLKVETVYEDGIRRTRREWDENGNLIYGGE